MKSIAFFADTTVLPGLHVALLSLLDKLGNVGDLSISIFTSQVSKREKEYLKKTHSILKKNTQLRLIDYQPKKIQNAGLLFGNELIYGRIFLSELLPESDSCIYLDCDLVVNADVTKLFDLFDGKRTLLSNGTGTVKGASEEYFYKKAGLDEKSHCFNSGVLGVDLALWRKNNMTEACKQMALKFRGIKDQGLLNVLFHNDFNSFGKKYNFFISPISEKLERVENCIYHFVGSPKPWDIFGAQLHNNYSFWKAWYKRTAISDISHLKYINAKRCLMISRSMFKTWRYNMLSARKY